MIGNLRSDNRSEEQANKLWCRFQIGWIETVHNVASKNGRYSLVSRLTLAVLCAYDLDSAGYLAGDLGAHGQIISGSSSKYRATNLHLRTTPYMLNMTNHEARRVSLGGICS